MNLKEYLNLTEEGTELTCWDDTIDSEFYFYNDEFEPDPDFPNVDLFTKLLTERLEIKEVKPNGVIVDLYGLLENPHIVQYAKDHLYASSQYECDEDVVELMFDDVVKNMSYGFERFSGKMLKAFDYADSQTKEPLNELVKNAEKRQDLQNIESKPQEKDRDI